MVRLLASLPAERRATILRWNERRHNARWTTTVPSEVDPLPQPHGDLEGAGRANSPEWADITVIGCQRLVTSANKANLLVRNLFPSPPADSCAALTTRNLVLAAPDEIHPSSYSPLSHS